MKKITLTILILTLLLILSGCSASILDVQDKIQAPENNILPIEGKWEIEKSIDMPYGRVQLNDADKLKGKEALFSDDAIVIGNDYATDTTYKLKNINLADYLLYKYKISPDILELDQEKATAITIFSNNQYFSEIIKYDEDKIFTVIEDRIYFLNKKVDKVSSEEIDRYINIGQKIMNISTTNEVETLRSGVLIGIKTLNYDEENQVEDWDYSTLWIKANNRNISSVYKIDELLVPRKQGFWNINVEREKNIDYIKDNIVGKQRGVIKEDFLDSGISPRMAMSMFIENITPSILKNILYVGNDYISTESIDLSTNKKTLQFYPIDYISDEKAIKISDILGEEGLKTFNEGAQSLIKNTSSVELNEESFGLYRRNGYWIIKGRVNYQSKEEELYKDYNIKSIPPKEVVNYDDLSIPWSVIKYKNPDAIDAFTSPNKDILIVQTRKQLVIYSINNDEISQKEIAKIDISPGDSIIMAEWATGRYTNLWEEELLKNKSESIKY